MSSETVNEFIQKMKTGPRRRNRRPVQQIQKEQVKNIIEYIYDMSGDTARNVLVEIALEILDEMGADTSEYEEDEEDE